MTKPSASSMKQHTGYGVFILPARPTGFGAGNLQFIKRCSRGWIHPDRATCLSHEAIGTRKISSRDAQRILIFFSRVDSAQGASILETRARRLKIF